MSAVNSRSKAEMGDGYLLTYYPRHLLIACSSVVYFFLHIEDTKQKLTEEKKKKTTDTQG